MKKITATFLLSAMSLFAMAQAPLRDTNQIALHDNTILIVDSQYMSCHNSEEAFNNDSILHERKIAPHEVQKKYRYSQTVTSRKRSTRVSASSKKHN